MPATATRPVRQVGNFAARRGFLTGALRGTAITLARSGMTARVVAASTGLAICTAAADEPTAQWMGTARIAPDRFELITFGGKGQGFTRLALPSRGHGATAHRPSGRAVVFARRPGNWFATIDLDRPEQICTIDAAPQRRFTGHGCFANDGRLLFTAEQDIDTASGRIGVHEATRGYRRIAEFETHGVGPHEIIALPQAGMIAVANGGIATHPDVGGGRDPLNLDDMAPSIVVLDTRDGRLVSRHVLAPERHRISLRHLAHDGVRRLFYAGQYARSDAHRERLSGDDTTSLAGFIDLPQRGKHTVESPLVPLELPDGLLPNAQGYLSSVASDGRSVLYTAARDDTAFLIDAASGELVERYVLDDVSGVAVVTRGFVVSSGGGDVVLVDILGSMPMESMAVEWDNHLARI